MTAAAGKEPVLICVAWPYANSYLHIGHMAGAYLPPDIFARYQRMTGRDVLMVSGSDTHGTPVTIQAEKEGITPAAVVERYHGKFIESFEKIGITFDYFTHTGTKNHARVVHEFFRELLDKGYIYKATSKQLFDLKAKRFLPDRYIEGECPLCGYGEARGDQCDNCGKTYDAVELKNPVSKLTGSRDLEVRDTEHFYIDLGKLNEPLLEWLSSGKDHWRKHVLNFARGTLEKRELRGTAITRDLEWGVTIPVPGYDTKRIYVWFEAVMGYLSATIEQAQVSGQPEAWRKYWDKTKAPDARTYYFIGKDNITFHTIHWPGYLIAKGGLNLPYDVPANEYLNNRGRKLSKSRGGAITVLDVMERYQADAWRYVLTALAPETGDVDFSWDDFLEKVNNELVANWGNLANRMLGFAFKRYEGKIPAPGTPLTADDEALLAEVKSGFATVGALYEGVKLRAALDEARRLSQRVNQYLSDNAPWTVVKTDPARAATCVYVALQCITWLNTMWAPILPESAQLIHTTLGFAGSLFGRQCTETVTEEGDVKHTVLRYDPAGAVGQWQAVTLPVGQAMQTPAAPFKKLEPDIVEKENAAAAQA
ncbi:MAG: methionine--tRNA ligase [Deltaproteobacteria bacterium]|nr:methionine--tRNA ligase [Deltaproteobacteria bacterium]